MIDRKKVIKALEDAYVTDGVIKMSIQVRDVLVAMLKEQEPLAVSEGKVNKCVCGNEINRYWHPEYCGFCGKKLEWY